MNRPQAVRGQPLLVLAVILGAWLIGRVMLWDSPFQDEARQSAIAFRGQSGNATFEKGHPPHERAAPRAGGSRRDDLLVALETGVRPVRVQPICEPACPSPRRMPAPPLDAAHGTSVGPRMLDVPLLAHPSQPTEAEAIVPLDRPLLGPNVEESERRLSADAWLLWRDGSAIAAAPGLSAYGRSQAGAVLRYSLLPGRWLAPAAYTRLSRTIEGAKEAEAAAGISLRPLRRVPVSIATEVRVTDTTAGREVRPAVIVVTQFAPVTLPLGLRGDAYLQAGHVGGRFATPFADGHARIDRRLAGRSESPVLRAGLGAWGGAQKGAARLDLGPTASAAFTLGGTSARLALDYRLRVAGDAVPSHGPAVTFSAGF